MTKDVAICLPIDHLLEHIAKKHGKDADELKRGLMEVLTQD